MPSRGPQTLTTVSPNAVRTLISSRSAGHLAMTLSYATLKFMVPFPSLYYLAERDTHSSR